MSLQEVNTSESDTGNNSNGSTSSIVYDKHIKYIAELQVDFTADVLVWWVDIQLASLSCHKLPRNALALQLLPSPVKYCFSGW